MEEGACPSGEGEGEVTTTTGGGEEDHSEDGGGGGGPPSSHYHFTEEDVNSLPALQPGMEPIHTSSVNN